jgi:WD40 repeat protein
MNARFRRFYLPNPLLIATLDVSPDGQTLVVGQQSDERSKLALGLWSIDDGRLVVPLITQEWASCLAARFSPSGRWLAYSDATENMALCDLMSGGTDREAFSLAFTKWIAFARDKDRLLAGGVRTQVWDADSRAIVWTLPIDPLPARSDIAPPHCALSSHGTIVAAAGVEPGRILLYDIEKNGVVGKLEHTMDDTQSMAFDPSGRFLAAVARSGGSGLWDLQSGEAVLPRLFNMQNDFYCCVQFHPDGEHVGFGLWSGFAKITRLKDGRTVVRGDTPPHTGRVLDIAFSRDGKRMFTGSDDGTLLVWELY